MPDRPNFLWLFSDEHSHRYLSGPVAPPEAGFVETPALNQLAASGTAFTDAYCPSPVCTPSRMCTLTGREQRNCGAWANGFVLPPDVTTLPGTFSDAGYETALIGKGHFVGTRQYAGFDRRPFGDLTGQHGHQGEPIPNRERGLAHHTPTTRIRDAGVTTIPESRTQEATVARETAAFVREQEAASGPWFACASFTRPHFPYTAPERFVDRHPPGEVPPPVIEESDASYEHPTGEIVREWMAERDWDDLTDAELRAARAAYAACVEYLDEVIGDLLATLERTGALENTVVIYTSDHGELAGEHGLWFKRTWHEGSVRVPLVVQTPAQRQGDADPAAIRTPVSLTDLFPTLCGLTDVPHPLGLDGGDLSTAVRDGVEPQRGPVVCDNPADVYGADKSIGYRMVREGKWKYVAFRGAPELLFDLDADPHETENLATDPPERAAEALEQLRSFVEDTYDFAAIDAEQERDAELRETYRMERPAACDVLGGVNAFHLPDGRVVRADDALYDPELIGEDPGAFASDWPGTDE